MNLTIHDFIIHLIIMKSALNQIDLCFVVDTTGSMNPFLSAARMALVNTLTALSRQSDLNLRVGVVEYRDHPPQEMSFVTKHYALTEDLSKIQKVIDGLSASGGGDAPEAVFDGVHEAAVLTEWRKNSARFILLVGDAPPQGYDLAPRAHRNDGKKNEVEYRRVCTCGLTLSQVTAAAEENRVVVQALPVQADELTRRAFTEIANATGGICGETANANAVIERIESLMAMEFGNLPLDRLVLEMAETMSEINIEAIAQTINAPRLPVAASLARLGKRGFLNG